MTMNHFQLIVIKRIDDHKAAEAKRLESEREKIRQEEAAKAETEARVRIEAEQREQAEARARQDREEQTVENKRIAVELAEMEARLQADKRAQICLDSPPYAECPGKHVCARLSNALALLIESRKWQALGEFGDPLGPECWTPEYRDYMQRLEAAIKE